MKSYKNVFLYSTIIIFVKTLDYDEVTPSSPLFAIDCEMVECYDPETDNYCKSLASVSIVNENREIIYHTYVKPTKYIVNYLTKYSGITPKIIQKATHTLEDVQKDISKLLPPDAILVGHSVSNDLEVLQLFHPYLIDTSLVYNLKHNRLLKPNLKLLSKIFLNRDIQLGGKLGHSSLEDALATMDLILLKLSKSFGFGNTVYNTDLGIQCDETILQTAEETDQEQPILIPELKKTEVPYSAEITSDTEHLNHKRKLKQIYDCGDCKNLLKYIDQYHITQVALVNDDMTGFSQPWVKNHLENEEICKSKPSNLKIPPLYISEISCASLNEGELPKKKWFCQLLKKVSKEFDILPQNSMCGLILVDGIFNAEKEDK